MTTAGSRQPPGLLLGVLLLLLPAACTTKRWIVRDDGQALQERLQIITSPLEARSCTGASGTPPLYDAPFQMAVSSLGYNNVVLYRLRATAPQRTVRPDQYSIAWNGGDAPDRANIADLPVSARAWRCSDLAGQIKTSPVVARAPTTLTARAVPEPAPVTTGASEGGQQGPSSTQGLLFPGPRRVGPRVLPNPLPPINPDQLEIIEGAFKLTPSDLAEFKVLDLSHVAGPGAYPFTLVTTGELLATARSLWQRAPTFEIEFLIAQAEGPNLASGVPEPFRTKVQLTLIRNNRLLGAGLGTAFIGLVFLTGLVL